MKVENSIEEDIKILEEFIKYYEAEATSRKFRGTLSIRVDEDDIDALENLINMYKRVLKENEYMHNELNKQQTTINKYAKENEELKAKWDKDTHILQNELDLTNADKINNYIPVQKVKDKIKKNEEIIDISDDVDTIHELYQENTIYEKLLESEE